MTTKSETSRARAQVFSENLNRNVMFRFGEKYEAGFDTLPKDLAQAYMHFKVAAESGYTLAPERLNLLMEKMTPSEVERGEELARQWATERAEGVKG